jgi:hypothetical protein
MVSERRRNFNFFFFNIFSSYRFVSDFYMQSDTTKILENRHMSTVDVTVAMWPDCHMSL